MKDGEKHTKGKFVSESVDSVSKAEHKYYASPDFIEIMKLKKDGNKHLKELTNKRQTAVLRIEIWRTLEASRGVLLILGEASPSPRRTCTAKTNVLTFRVARRMYLGQDSSGWR